MNTIVEKLLHNSSNDPREVTYVGIGSYPYQVNDLVNYNDDRNQMFPLFVRKAGEGKSIRVINIDSGFIRENVMGYEYLTSIGLTQVLTDNKTPYEVWRNRQIEFIIIPMDIQEEDRYHLCSQLSVKTFHTTNKIFIQEFSGRELLPSFTKFINAHRQNLMFIRRNVIWDITYGEECSCSTKLTDYPKVVLSDGEIFNLWTYTHHDMLRIIQSSKNTTLNNIIYVVFKKYYKDTIMKHHVNYRRSLIGLSRLYETTAYPYDASSKKIMTYILDEIELVVHGLKILTKKTQEEMEAYTKKLISYEMYDPHKWYSDVMLYFD